MDKTLRIIVDADAIIAQANPQDSSHKLAVATSKKLTEMKAEVLYPASAILEATTVLQGRLNSGATAYKTADVFTNTDLSVLDVNQQMLTDAITYFDPTANKKDTLFDCVIMALADKYDADAIFSFDKVYKKKGFKLASELKLIIRK